MSVPERFTSRWGLILAAIGMAVGAGNIWPFIKIIKRCQLVIININPILVAFGDLTR